MPDPSDHDDPIRVITMGEIRIERGSHARSLVDNQARASSHRSWSGGSRVVGLSVS